MAKPDSWMPLYIGDYMADTMHLSTEQHGAYLLLLLTAWNRGGKLANDEGQLAIICRADKKAWSRIRGAVLPFFKVEGGFLVQTRLLVEYEKAGHRYATKVANGSKGGRPKQTEQKPVGYFSDTPPDTPPGGLQQTQPQPQESIPLHVRKVSSASASRLPAGWTPSDADQDFCRQARPDLKPLDVADRFRDYWAAVPGAKGRKLDWPATWRNWVRSEKTSGSAGHGKNGSSRADRLAETMRELTGQNRADGARTFDGIADRVD